MPMRVGEMMVVVRAQDFASRTLRRVSGELSGLSQQQMLSAKQMQLTAGRQRALFDIEKAQRSIKPLQLIQRRNQLVKSLAASTAELVAAEKQLKSVRGGRGQLSAQPMLGTVTAHAKRSAISFLMNDIDALTKKVSMQSHQVGRLDRVLDSLGGKYLRLRDNVSAFNRAQGIANQRLSEAYGRLNANQRAQLDLNEAIRNLPLNKLDRVAHAMSGIGRTMQLFGGLSTAAFGLAANAAAKFDTQMSLAATQARDIGAGPEQVQLRIEQLSEGIGGASGEIAGVLDLMEKYPARAEEMSAATYDIFSSMDLERNGVINVAKGLGLLEDANKIAVAGGAGLEEATSAMITTLNNFDPQLQNTTEQFDTMFDIVRFGRMRLSDFNIMMNKIAPAAADAGMELEDVAGAMAYLTTVMPSQRMVSTGISRLIEALRHPDIVAGLDQFGISAKDSSGKLRPLNELLMDLAKTFPELTTGQKSAAEFFRELSAVGRGGGRGQIFTQEGRRALSEIMTHFDEYLDIQRRIRQNTDEFARSHAAQMQSLGVQWQVFLNKLRALGIAIGQDAIPVFTELGKVIQALLDAWNKLPDDTQKMIVRIAALGAVTTLLAGIFLSLIGGMLAFEVAMRSLAGSGAGAAGVLRGLLGILGRIAALAVIAVMIKVQMQGDAKAIDFLMGLMAGAVAGFAVGGPIGALVGGLTVPVVLQIQTEINKMRGDRNSPWQQYVRDTMRENETISKEGFEEWKKNRAIENAAMAKTLKQQAKLGPLRTGVHQTAARAHKDAMKEQAQAEKKAKKATKEHNDELAARYKKLQQAREAQSRYNRELKEWNARLADTTKQAGEDVVNNLRDMYTGMEAANRQAFGELFQGPWLSGTTFDLAKQWGIKPRIDDMIRDLNMQTARFRQWRQSLNKALTLGVPRDFVDQIKQMGPEEGQDFLTQIIEADPKKRAALIAAWNKSEKLIKQTSVVDFKDEIDRFRAAGLKMGDAIKLGFKEARVAAWFDNWVSNTFPSVINSAVNQAVSEWKAANPKPTNEGGKIPPGTRTAAGAGTFRTGVGAGASAGASGGTTKIVNVTINPPHPMTDPDARKLAWYTKNAVRTAHRERH